MAANTDTRPIFVPADDAVVTSTRVVPVVADKIGTLVPKGTKGVLALVGDDIVVLTRVEVKSRRYVLQGAQDVYARKANTVKVFKAHGRLVKVGSTAARKIIAAHIEKIEAEIASA